MLYIYSECYSPIFFALYKVNMRTEVTILTINKNVEKFCELMGIKCIFFHHYSIGIFNCWMIRDFKRQLKDLVKSLKWKEGDTFYILDNAFALDGFYLSRLLRGKKSSFYYPTIKYNNFYNGPYLSKTFILSIFVLILYKIFTGMDLILLSTGGKPTLGIGNKFFKRNNIQVDNSIIDFRQLKLDVIKTNSVKLDIYEIMLADHGKLSGEIKFDSYEAVCNEIFTNAKSLVIKEHPRLKQDHLFKDIKCFPDYIPGELLLGNITRIVLSIYSEVLIIASKTDHLKAVSLLELIDWEDEELKNSMKKKLITLSDNRIIFVQSTYDLIEMIT